MSSDETQSALSRAYDLVEAGKYDEARAILEPILAANKDNADAWWVYAHAVTNPDDGRAALENVLRIDPKYPDAADLLAQARAVAPERPTITPLAPVTMPEAPPSLPEADFPEVPAPARATSEQSAAPVPSSRAGLPLIPILAVIVIIVLVVLVVLSQSSGSSTPPPTATQVAIVATSTNVIAEAATSEVTQEVIATEAPTLAATNTTVAAVTEAATVETTSAASSADYSAIQTAMSAFSLPQNGIAEVQTSLGNTLQVTACTTAGRAMRTLLPQVMNALAKQSGSLGSSIQAIGVHLINCGQNTPLLTVATDLASAHDYAQGKLSDSEFSAKWKPQ